ncbi:transposase [Nocardia sp. NPDC050710]|uniref:transposase n=1 Tax=Nocardia sp. NPDC050710 TaxID=3157220 RepID=UPI00340AFE6F
MGLHGIGPCSVARLLADTGDIHRFGNRDRFASWNCTAPRDASSGEQATTSVPAWEPARSTGCRTLWPWSNSGFRSSPATVTATTRSV